MFTTTMLLLLCLFTLAVLFLITSEVIAFLRTRVPFRPTSVRDVRFFVKELGIKPTDVFYDLGSGNGKVVFLVESLSGARVKGFELGWWTLMYSKIKSKLKNSKAQFVYRDFFKENWSEANYIYGYLFPGLMAKVEQKFLADCKPGSIAIIRDFPFPKLKATQKYYLPKKHEIYVYKKV